MTDVQDKLFWAYSNGIVIAKNYQTDENCNALSAIPTIVHAPIALNPFKFPRSAFEKAARLATVFNTLVDRVAQNDEFLTRSLSLTGQNDEFTGRLIGIYNDVKNDPLKQTWSLGIHRSDYMQHSRVGDCRNLLQVEINTIASSFGSLSTKIAQMQRAFSKDNNIPENDAIANISMGIGEASAIYAAEKQLAITDIAVIMIVQANEKNFSDQRMIQNALIEKYGIRTIRATLAEVEKEGILDESDRVLRFHDKIISVVYFRAGYTPNDYPTEDEWKGRTKIERSQAIKCPNIAYHLVGTKKIQQVLAGPGVLEMFFDSSEDSAEKIALLRNVFAGLYSLDIDEHGNWSSEQQKLIDEVLADPTHFVMKPQREGGGNNYYGEDIVNAFKTMTKAELSAHILMEKIYPPSQSATMLRNATIIDASCICELGIYSIHLSKQGEEKINQYGGYLLRVKADSSNEGGVAAGYAVLGCPTLQS